ncbi:MAG: phosphatidylserine synthase [Candidatus Sericytochromatia bacterium]|nr:MAG: phosphatidylserine synthase [Candidatus Sericytochromatia bacterium]
MFIGVYNIPNLVSLLGLVLSLMSCFLSYNNYLNLAIICFMYAGLCDMFDGFLARKKEMNDEDKLFGIQLDSIVDVVSFGVAPAMIAFHIGFTTFIDYLILIFYVCCAAMRLAYFNVHGTKSDGKRKYYTGLPVTFSAMIFPFVYITSFWGNDLLYNNLVRLTFITISILFILRIPVPKLGGLFYVLAPFVTLFLTFFWLYIK